VLIRRHHDRATYCPALDETTVRGVRFLDGMYDEEF